VFARRSLKGIYSQMKEKGKWRSRYNHELYKLRNEPDEVKTVGY
jgi:hypothetical protein